jgi:hypothetical protein
MLTNSNQGRATPVEEGIARHTEIRYILTISRNLPIYELEWAANLVEPRDAQRSVHQRLVVLGERGRNSAICRVHAVQERLAVDLAPPGKELVHQLILYIVYLRRGCEWADSKGS